MRSLLLLLTMLLIPTTALAQVPDHVRRDAEMVRRMQALERQNRMLENQVGDLRLEVHDLKKSRRFSVGRLFLTTLISTAAVSASFYAADRVFGDSARKVYPNLSTERAIGMGALLAAGPSLIAGIGSGARSSALTTTGITLDTLLAVAPWIAGAALHGFARSLPASQSSDSAGTSAGEDPGDASNETEGGWGL